MNNKHQVIHDFNIFAGAFVDRSGERRKDSAWLEQAAKSPDSRFVSVWGESWRQFTTFSVTTKTTDRKLHQP
jgi:hypothetical protein